MKKCADQVSPHEPAEQQNACQQAELFFPDEQRQKLGQKCQQQQYYREVNQQRVQGREIAQSGLYDVGVHFLVFVFMPGSYGCHG